MTTATAVLLVAAGCGSSPEDQSVRSSVPAPVPPTSPPSGLSWNDFHRMQVPTADQGPHITTPDEAPHGFDHSGPGAALAAINASERISVADDAQWPQVATTLLAPGIARDNFTVTRLRYSIRGDAENPPHVCGYTIADYHPTKAVVSIITRQHDGSITATSSEVVWTADGDWKLQLSAPGSTTAAVTALSASPANLIALKGQCS